MARVQVGVGSTVSIGEIEGATLVTEAEGISSNDNDTTIPTSAAVKDYADSVAGTPSVITVTDESSDSTCFPLFVTAATGNLGPKTATGLMFDSTSDTLAVTALSIGSLTGVLRADLGGVSVDSDVTDIVSAASDSAAGKVELATAAETTTGTDTGRAVTPDALAGSNFGAKPVSIQVTDGSAAITTGDGKAYVRIPSYLNGMNIVNVAASLTAPSTSGTPTIQIARGRQSSATSAHTFVDVLSTAVTIDANEYDSKDATTSAVINTSNDDVATGDLIRVDVDGVGSGPTAVLTITIGFQLP